MRTAARQNPNSYLRELTNYMHRPPVGPTTIFEDNQGAIHLVENPVHHKRTKHICWNSGGLKVEHFVFLLLQGFLPIETDNE